MIQLKTIAGIFGSLLPSVQKQKAQSHSVDTVFSKRGETTTTEVYVAFGYKLASLAFKAYLVYAIINGNVSLGEILKVLSIGV